MIKETSNELIEYILNNIIEDLNKRCNLKFKRSNINVPNMEWVTRHKEFKIFIIFNKSTNKLHAHYISNKALHRFKFARRSMITSINNKDCIEIIIKFINNKQSRK